MHHFKLSYFVVRSLLSAGGTYDVDVVKGYNIYQYIFFGIQLCSIIAKCWKLSKYRKWHIFTCFFKFKVYF